jgi:ribosomal protein S18 acetylase RimI-like enzyme
MDDVHIRRELRPGDVGAIVRLHGLVYGAEHGLDHTFETYVARTVADVVEGGFPADDEGVWLVEAGDELVGMLALTREAPDAARVRWFVFQPALRGRGLGRRLVDELVAFADAAGYERIVLETFDRLATAAHLYRSHGFALREAAERDLWGQRLRIEQYTRLRPA